LALPVYSDIWLNETNRNNFSDPGHTFKNIIFALKMNHTHHKHPRKPEPGDMIFGIFPVLEALRNDSEPDKILLQQGLKTPHMAELRELIRKADIPAQVVPREKLDRLTRSNHQGVIAMMSPIAFQPLDEVLSRVFEQGRDPFFLLLDRVTDVRNFGAICRTAECAGVDAVIVPSRGSARIGADALKTSAGALMNIPVCRSNNLKDTIDYLKNSGLKVVACTEKGDFPLFDAPMKGPMLVMMGSEEDGISHEYLKRADYQVIIPMFGKTASLNVSVATALVLYEVLRKKEKNQQ
jgi:23S rRNA (guanosine2251-2'-O)-methyltransferase